MSKKLLLLFPLIFISLLSFGQFFYTDYTSVDQVDISYKWKNVKESPKELRLKLKNHNPYPVLLSLEVDYYMNGILKENVELDAFCLNAGRMVAGKLNGIIFTSSLLSNEELESGDFEFKINDIQVEQTETCKTGKKEKEEQEGDEWEMMETEEE